jgi:NADH-quinone oxidoreductase subunit L
MKLAASIAMLAGLATAYVVYMMGEGRAEALAKTFRPLYTFFFNKWYFDELYDWLFVKPAFVVGRLFWKAGDQNVIDRFGPNGAAALVGVGSRMVGKMQSGYIYSYALVMLLGLVAAISWAMVK